MVANGLPLRALRRGFGERAEDHVDHAQDRLGIAADRARRRHAEQVVSGMTNSIGARQPAFAGTSVNRCFSAT